VPRASRRPWPIRVAVVLAVVAAGALLRGQTPSIEGRWRTIDDKTGEAKSIVVIAREGETFAGRVERVFAPPAPSTNPLCDKCDGELKDQPIVGMRVLWGFRQDGDRYKDGRLLDPESGNVYHGTLRMTDGGRSLQVRGYVGISMFGRTQTWKREP
jgi:uncharacterized protein (DUF2147 family)